MSLCNTILKHIDTIGCHMYSYMIVHLRSSFEHLINVFYLMSPLTLAR